MIRPAGSLAALVPAMALAACAAGPDFHAPAPPAQQAYTPQPITTAGEQRLSPAPVDARWWTLFGSPELNALVDQALAAIGKGGSVICAGIHMSDIPSFPYEMLWGERTLRSVANLTRQDGLDFLSQVPKFGIVTRTTPYPLQQANQALADLRAGRFEGAAVLIP